MPLGTTQRYACCVVLASPPVGGRIWGCRVVQCMVDPCLCLGGQRGSSPGGSARGGMGVIGDAVTRHRFASLTMMDFKIRVRSPQYLGDSARLSKYHIRQYMIGLSRPKCPKISPKTPPKRPPMCYLLKYYPLGNSTKLLKLPVAITWLPLHQIGQTDSQFALERTKLDAQKVILERLLFQKNIMVKIG